MTISIGLAMARDTDHSLEQIIARADTQLYRAKDSGRNTVCHDESFAASLAHGVGRKSFASAAGLARCSGAAGSLLRNDNATLD
jgi:hypothetical protein